MGAFLTMLTSQDLFREMRERAKVREPEDYYAFPTDTRTADPGNLHRQSRRLGAGTSRVVRRRGDEWEERRRGQPPTLRARSPNGG